MPQCPFDETGLVLEGALLELDRVEEPVYGAAPELEVRLDMLIGMEELIMLDLEDEDIIVELDWLIEEE